MKLRIRENSIRVRLGPREVAGLLERNMLEQRTPLGSAVDPIFTYRLRLDPAAGEIFSRFGESTLTIHIPTDQAHVWAEGPTLELHTGTATIGKVHISIEKDLQCRDEINSSTGEDVYPIPISCPET